MFGGVMLDNTLVFDIETVPDIDAGIRLYELDDLPLSLIHISEPTRPY